MQFYTDNYSRQEDGNKPEYMDSKQPDVSSDHCGRVPDKTNRSHVSDSFHHSVLLFYQ